MMTKRLKAIASAALLLDKEETSDDKDHKTHKNHSGFDHGFNGRKKLAVTPVI